MKQVEAATYYVGPDMQYTKPSQVAAVAQDGDLIEIERGVYQSDVAIWRQNNITIRGIGGRAHIKANGAAAQGKGIWVIKGDNILVENIEFSGARVSDRNGAGIRMEGSGLNIRNCYFHDNENGILAGKNPKSEILIEQSIFENNGYGDGQSHNMYIGYIKRFTIRNSYIHHAKVGHNVKSRAAENFILYNRIMDEHDGSSSYGIDLPNGGKGYIIGNIIQQGPYTENSTMFSYGTGAKKHLNGQLYIVNNTFVNDRKSGNYIRVASEDTKTIIINNIFAGKGRILVKRGEQKSNLISKHPGFKDPKNFDYTLKSNSAAIDSGTMPGVANGFKLVPVFEYVHVAKTMRRSKRGLLDIGAYEFVK